MTKADTAAIGNNVFFLFVVDLQSFVVFFTKEIFYGWVLVDAIKLLLP